jgi:hypothetical protein
MGNPVPLDGFAPSGGGPRHRTALRAPSLDEIGRITAEPDAVLRNLRITQCYHDLSAALARVIDPGNANWSTFAAWASLTAGISIRDEELPRVVVELLRDEARLRPRLGRFYAWTYRHTWAKIDLPQQARETIRGVSLAVAEGNLKVFAELAPLFARFAGVMDSPAAERGPRLQSFLADLRPGASDRDGQDALRRAFSNYAAAAGESDAEAKAQLILLANCQIGLHEQTRLQDDIEGAMNAPVGAFVTDGVGRLILIRLAFLLLRPFGLRRERVRGVIQEEWQRVATRHSLQLSLPEGRVLPLGGDSIPWPTQVPEPLRTLRHTELMALLQRFDEDTQRLRTRGADNWSRLSDRMGFICELFRAAQQNASLFDEPFSETARADIARGIVPAEWA